MSTQTPDGVDDALMRETQMVLMVGAQMGEKFAQQSAERRRHMEQITRQERRDMEARWEAQRMSARQQLRDVNTDRFWSQSSPDDIAQRYATAQQWAEHDEVAYRAAGTMEQQIQDRYGLSPQQYIDQRTEAGRERRQQETLSRIQETGTGEWWRRSDPLDVSKAYRAAVARADDPQFPFREEAAAARDRITDGLERHTGIASTDDLTALVDQQMEATQHANLDDLDSDQWWEQASGPEIAERFATVHGLDDAPEREALDAKMRQELAARHDVFPATGATELSGRHIMDIDEAHMPAAERETDRPSETLAAIGVADAAERGAQAQAQGMPIDTVHEHAQVQPVTDQDVDNLIERLQATIGRTPEGRDGLEGRRVLELDHGVNPEEAVNGPHGHGRPSAARGMEHDREQGNQLGL